MLTRILSLSEMLARCSVFLFGPRQTGKTTLVKTSFPDAKYFNLLEADVFRELCSRPELIRKSITPNDKIIIIDEIQRIPQLLNEVQTVIDSQPALRFILTGSSARSLRKGGVNLLGGRATIVNLFPLVSSELSYSDTDKRLEVGSLPKIILSKTPYDDLKDYVGVYLSEEIRAEGLVRNIETFSRFLEVAALSNGQLINFTSIGSDTGVPPRTIREHFQILEDTLIGKLLKPNQKTIKRKPIATAKFYFFDVGVANCLINRRTIAHGTREFGDSLEHLIFTELSAYLSYKRLNKELSFWRTQSQLEVDFVVGDEIGIEVKASNRVGKADLKGLNALSEELNLKRKIIVCLSKYRLVEDTSIEIFPLDEFLKDLWADKIISDLLICH